MALTVQRPQVPLGGTRDTRVMPQDHCGEKTGQMDGVIHGMGDVGLFQRRSVETSVTTCPLHFISITAYVCLLCVSSVPSTLHMLSL